MAKKHIMDLPTNVPRLKKGAGLFDGEIYDETKAPDVGKKGVKLKEFQEKRKEASKMPMRKVFGTNIKKFKKDKAEYVRKQSSPFNKEFYDIFRKGKPKIEDYSNPLPKPKKKLSI